MKQQRRLGERAAEAQGPGFEVWKQATSYWLTECEDWLFVADGVPGLPAYCDSAFENPPVWNPLGECGAVADPQDCDGCPVPFGFDAATAEAVPNAVIAVAVATTAASLRMKTS